MFKDTTVIKHNNGYLYIDTRFTSDHGWETMAFPCDDEYGNNVDFRVVVVEKQYSNIFAAYQGHVDTVVHFMKQFL